MNAYRILDNPAVFRLSQFLLAPGQQLLMRRNLQTLARGVPQAGASLDIGCGPSSWLWRIGLDPVGFDLAASYIRQFRQNGQTGVVGSADTLPFRSASFDSVWTIGLLHHLDDHAVLDAVREMIRVCRAGGSVVIVDAVMPKHWALRPVAYVVRRLDRGRFIRSQNQFVSLLRTAVPSLPNPRRFTFALTGLEAVALLIPVDSDT